MTFRSSVACGGVLILVTFSLDAAPAEAGPLSRVSDAAKRQWSEVRASLSSKARVSRIVVSASVGAAAGFVAQHHGTTYPEAVFAAYAVGEVVDRTIQLTVPQTRSLTPDTRGPLAWGLETFAISTVAAVSASMLQHQMEPFTHTLLGRATPGVIGVGAGAMFPRSLVRGTLMLGVSALTQGTRAGIDGVRRIQAAAKRTITRTGEQE